LYIASPAIRAYDATDWKARTFDRWNDFLAVASAGNSKDKFSVSLHPGLGMASYGSYMNMATMSDPFYPSIQNGTLWSSMVTPDSKYADLTAYVINLGMDTVGPANNILSVGSTTRDYLGAVHESLFSNSGPDVKAVGENVVALSHRVNGTSFSAPQVAGLASYLWILSPDLRNQPVLVTRQAILANTRNNSFTTGIIDAYATVLSLDATAISTPDDAPVRHAILDWNEDGGFDEADVSEFLSHYEDPITHQPVEPLDPDYSRFDLNGDGYTGGSRKERFDLDRTGSTQYGESKYSVVTQDIEEQSTSFDENSLTDLEILCYYAYSSLYTGDIDKLKELLGNKCSACEEVGDGFEEGLTANYSNGRQAFEGPINHGWDWGCPGDDFNQYNLYQNVCTPLSMSPVHWAKGGWGGEDDETAFNVFWNGYLFAPKDGAYFFGGWVDGSVLIEINGEVVTDMDTTGSSYGYTMTLQGGNWVPISMSFKTNGGSNNMRLRWRLPGASSGEYVPRACLKHQAGP